MGKSGGVVNTVMKRDDASLKAIDIDSSIWRKRLFKKMDFVKCASTTRKVPIPDDAFKEGALPFHLKISNYFEK